MAITNHPRETMRRDGEYEIVMEGRGTRDARDGEYKRHERGGGERVQQKAGQTRDGNYESPEENNTEGWRV